MAKITDIGQADVCIVYAAGAGMDLFDAIGKQSKNMILFCRHKSGPVYLWYEIISPRYLRQHTDALKVQGIDDGDVIVDNQDEILWRLRALCGLQNTLGTKILCIGGPGAWAQPEGVVPNLVRDVWKFDMQTVSYDDLGKLIKEARADAAAVSRAKERATAYLKAQGRQAGDQAGVRRERLPAGAGLPRPDEEGRLPGDHDQRLHGHDHAAWPRPPPA